jgi:radical SAM protein with 4Fe4S-binding SPASM domain
MTANPIKLSDRVKTRKEYFGGILFNMDTGDVIEVDREAYKVISTMKESGAVDMETLLNLSNRTKIQWPGYKHLSAPETIHWALTYRCEQSCPDCYISRYKGWIGQELDSQQALKLVDKIAGSGAFQLAIGGGEPFLRNDLTGIVQSASEKGLTVHITTGKYDLENKLLTTLAKYIRVLQIGIRQDELFHQGNYTAEKLRALVIQLNECKICTGANLIMTRSSICSLDRILERLMGIGFKKYTLLRYKPPGDINRWLQEKPDKNDFFLLEEKLISFQEKYPDAVFRIDCALSFLERNLNPRTAFFSGIKGCTAFDRIMAVAPDGSVYPCSQLVGDKFKTGNLLNEDFNIIWHENKLAEKYRNFRTFQRFRTGSCGKCQANTFCGGCRVFAGDAIGPDPGCPEPIYGNKNEIGNWLEDGAKRGYLFGANEGR